MHLYWDYFTLGGLDYPQMLKAAHGHSCSYCCSIQQGLCSWWLLWDSGFWRFLLNMCFHDNRGRKPEMGKLHSSSTVSAWKWYVSFHSYLISQYKSHGHIQLQRVLGKCSTNTWVLISLLSMHSQGSGEERFDDDPRAAVNQESQKS